MAGSYVDELNYLLVWRDLHVETNYDLCYARSFDNGVTWHSKWQEI